MSNDPSMDSAGGRLTTMRFCAHTSTRLGLAQADQGRLREQFVINLQRFASGNIPKATAADRARAERALKAAVTKAEEFTPSPHAFSMEPTPGSLRSTERVWERLFAAWMRFLPVAYPSLSLDQAATELLRLRIHQLRKAAPPSVSPRTERSLIKAPLPSKIH